MVPIESTGGGLELLVIGLGTPEYRYDRRGTQYPAQLPTVLGNVHPNGMKGLRIRSVQAPSQLATMGAKGEEYPVIPIPFEFWSEREKILVNREIGIEHPVVGQAHYGVL